jgi:hypothetical protein
MRERYVNENRDNWRVRCVECGIVAEDIDTVGRARSVADLHAATVSGYVRTGAAVLRLPVIPLLPGPRREMQLVPMFFGTTHVLDVATDRTLCGLSNQWQYTAGNPELVWCSACRVAVVRRRGSTGSSPA